MNIKKYVFHLTVAVAAFLTGFAGYTACEYFGTFFFDRKTVLASEHITPVACVTTQAAPVPTAEPIVFKNEPFNATGDYYPFDEDLPAAFKDFEYFSIETHEHDETAEAENAWTPIKPRGSVHAKRAYKFKTLTLSPTYLSFETEVKDGVSYRFVGRIRDDNSKFESENWDEPGEIRGKFMKVRNGEVIATIKVAYFGISGC